MFLSAVRRFSQKSNILVVGGGQIGKSVALGLNRHGYENITVADPNNANQGVLEEAGIKEGVLIRSFEVNRFSGRTFILNDQTYLTLVTSLVQSRVVPG